MTDKKGDNQRLAAPARREILRKLGRFTAVNAPAITLLLAAQSRPASAQVRSGCAALPRPDRTKIV